MSQTVSARVALSLRALGAIGEAWLAGLPSLLADLATDWSITLGARLDGGGTAYVAEATTSDGTAAVLKVAIPPGTPSPYDRELAALRLAGGDPYARLIRFDRGRQALLLERLGRPLAELGWPAGRQLDVLVRTAARGWRPVPDDGLPGWVEAARWHAQFVPAAWEELGRPCSEAAVDLAVRCAEAREAAFRPGASVLVHGDVHAFNALQGDDGFRLVDPGGLWSEPAHDLGVILARGVRPWLDDLAGADPQRASQQVSDRCRRAGRMTGTDPEAIRQWAFMELLSTGLHVLRLGDHREAQTYLAVADRLAETRAGKRRRRPARLYLMVGLPGSGKTTRAGQIAVTHRALRLTPDEWMISLFDGVQPDGKRDLLEGHLITLALQALRRGVDVVLDFGLWSRDERSALRWLATTAGASTQVIYLPVDAGTQRARIAHRQATAPRATFPMSDADLTTWRTRFEAPDAPELDGAVIPAPPPPWPGWPKWAAGRWPSLAGGSPSGDLLT